MKSTGIVRKVDSLGRIVIPMELRKTLNIDDNDSLEIYTDGDTIILRKHHVGCIFCGEVNNIKVIDGVPVCEECAKKIAAAHSVS